MRIQGWILVIAIAAAAMAVACSRGGNNPGGDPVLLGSGGVQAVDPSGEGVADNSRCHVCHLNYAVEELAVNHANEGIGCEDCHGQSDPHCGDEDNITPPDIMYGHDEIIPSCMKCHPEGRLELEDEHKELLAGNSKDVCTDCHGDHRLSHRTRRWDKKTGELIDDDNVRMIEDPPLP